MVTFAISTQNGIDSKPSLVLASRAQFAPSGMPNTRAETVKRRLAVFFFSLCAVACTGLWFASVRPVTLAFAPPQGMTVTPGCGGVFLVSPLGGTVPFKSLTLGYRESYGLTMPRFSRGSIFGSGANNIPGVWAVWLPFWPFVLGNVVLALLAWRLRRPPPPGHCRTCGYDLTGNVTGMCSECGSEIVGRADAPQTPSMLCSPAAVAA